MAQDRLWQMDYMRRKAMGRLSEILGPEALDQDVIVSHRRRQQDGGGGGQAAAGCHSDPP